MSGRFGALLICGVLGGVLLVASPVSAQVGPGWGGGPGGYGLGFFNYGNGLLNQQQLPYFSVYPPVYYSYVVPRPYGFSPFAYPPGTMTPEVTVSPPAATYHNPFVPKKGAENADQLTTVPRTYINPFVKARAAGETTVAARADQ